MFLSCLQHSHGVRRQSVWKMNPPMFFFFSYLELHYSKLAELCKQLVGGELEAEDFRWGAAQRRAHLVTRMQIPTALGPCAESNQVKQANVYGKACRTDSCSLSHTVYSPVLKALVERRAALFHNIFPHLVFKWCSVRKVWRIHCSKMLVFSLTEIWWLCLRSTICIIVLKLFSEPWTVCRCCIHYRTEHDVKHDTCAWCHTQSASKVTLFAFCIFFFY